jgi:SprT protein
MKNNSRIILRNYLPEEAITEIIKLIQSYNFSLKITRKRWSKLGDYTHPHGKKGHRITINHDLNKFSFLITLIHEIAHLSVWNKFKNKVQPHGLEWKREFKIHLDPFIALQIFPSDITVALQKYISDPGASSCSDVDLIKLLRNYDTRKCVYLEDLPDQSIFQLQNGKRFLKGEKLRKRYKCIDLKSRSIYLISPVAEVIKENTLF